MALPSYSDTVWRPGQPLEPTAKIMSPEELSQRLLYAEKVLSDLQVGDLPIAELQRQLEQNWGPDSATLLPAGSVTREVLAVSWAGGTVGSTGTKVYTVAGAPEWSVVRNGAGDYTVTFPPYKAVPLAFAMPKTGTTEKAPAKTAATVQFTFSADTDFDWMVWGK